MGHENLRKPEISAAVVFAQQERAQRTGVTADRVISELARIGFSDLRKAVQWGVVGARMGDEGGEVVVVDNAVSLLPSSELDDDTAAAIAEVSQTATGGLKIKLHDKCRALEMLGKHLGIYVEKVEHSGSVGVTLNVNFGPPAE